MICERLEGRLLLATLEYSSFLGGNSIDPSFAVAVDAEGSTYVTGSTGSVSFPATAGAFDGSVGGIRDAYVAKFNADGSLTWATYLGGAGEERGHGIAVDALGNVYVTGRTNSPDYPTTAGSLDVTLGGEVDAFVTKLNPDGTALAYSTFLGGTGFEIDQTFDEQARTIGDIAVDAAGQAFVTGSTTSSNFPTTAGAFRTTRPGLVDVFVSKLNAAGSALVYSTYLGGSDADRGHGIAIDSNGNAHVTGEVVSANFPTTAGAFQRNISGISDSFVTKLNAAGTALIYSSYLGGTGTEYAGRVAVDQAGHAYLTGSTGSFNFPTTPGAFQPIKADSGGDAYVTKMSLDGSALVYSTHLGGTFGGESGTDIDVDASGQAYVTGATSSGTFPVADAFQPSRSGSSDAFVTKFNAAGSALIYSSYLGGGRTDTAYGIAVDANGTAHVAGQTDSSGQFAPPAFPTSAGAFQPNFAGGANDAFVVRITDDSVAPTVNASEFVFADAPQALVFTFTENVSASLSVADLLLENLTTGQTIPSGNIALSYDANTNTATFTFPGYFFGALPDGNYRATLIAAGITDAAGNVLDGDGNGTAGGNAVAEFFFLNGDANRDRNVNLADFNILRANFGGTGKAFSQGDFTYDGVVNLADFNILRSKFGTFLPANGGNLFGGDDGDDDGGAGQIG